MPPLKWTPCGALLEYAADEGVPEFPIAVPTTIGKIDGENPAVGIFVFPDNANAGSLEDILYECSSQTHPEVSVKARSVVDQLDTDLTAGHRSLRNLRSGLGKAKATMGIVATILKPGTSLSVAVEQQNIVPNDDQAPDMVEKVNAFLAQALQR